MTLYSALNLCPSISSVIYSPYMKIVMYCLYGLISFLVLAVDMLPLKAKFYVEDQDHKKMDQDKMFVLSYQRHLFFYDVERGIS